MPRKKAIQKSSRSIAKKRVNNKTNAYERICAIIENARNNIARAVNTEMVLAYWHIGKEIVEEEQKGKKRAGYGKKTIEDLSHRLSDEFGKGFDFTNLTNMRKFYLAYPILDAVRQELSWTHYRILMRVDKPDARSFYEAECVANNWSARELERQKGTLLYERLALSKDKKGLMRLARKGQELATYEDMIKDPYVLEFTGLSPHSKLYESKLEQALIDNLSRFLLELGKGFTFVGRQKRITLDGDHFYVDLVFYNTILKCFVLIDLKIGKLVHQDIGQMQMYVNYYDRSMKQKDDNPTVGLILCEDKKDAVVRYTLPKDNKQIFASRYKLYLPTEDELVKELKRERFLVESQISKKPSKKRSKKRIV
ncbi:MAG: PDDEXK nuclease domain-containing protein [Candidatus Omnitrophica bacterium]|nr:PDDEXK nuclease domain-containing protein [Candidatus Omnitrophota bacterium]